MIASLSSGRTECTTGPLALALPRSHFPPVLSGNVDMDGLASLATLPAEKQGA